MQTHQRFLVLAAALLAALGLALATPVSAQVPYVPGGSYPSGVGIPVPGATATQAPMTTPCPGGPQPIITSRIESASLLPSFLSSGFLTPGVFTGGFGFGGFGGFGFPSFGSGVLITDRVTEISNFNGVEGLVLTVFSGDFARPVLGLGVPDYLFRAYGGNLNAIQQDLTAGYLRCRSS